MSKATTSYVLKAKYNGIRVLPGTKNQYILRTADLTDEIAEKAIKDHPAGLNLFEKYPKQQEGKQTSKSLNPTPKPPKKEAAQAPGDESEKLKDELKMLQEKPRLGKNQKARKAEIEKLLGVN